MKAYKKDDVIAYVMIASRRCRKNEYKDQDRGRKLSQYEIKGDGKAVFASVLHGSLPDEFADAPMPTIPIRFNLDEQQDREKVLRAGVICYVKGRFGELTKTTSIFIITDVTVKSPKANSAYMREHGLNPDMLKEQAGSIGKLYMQDSPEMREQREEVSQEITQLADTLRRLSIPADIDMGVAVNSFLRVRAREERYETVADMVQDNPMVLAEYEDDSGTISYNSMLRICKDQNIVVPDEIKLAAAVTSELQRCSRQGHACWGAVNLYALADIRRYLGAMKAKYMDIWAYLRDALAIDNGRKPMLRAYAKLRFDGSTRGPKAYKEDFIAYYTQQILDSSKEDIELAAAEKKAANAWDAVYLNKSYWSEAISARALAEHIGGGPDELALETAERVMEELPLELDESQVEAVHKAFSNNVSVIIGAAGTGKTTVIGIICETAKRLGLDPALLAPTARAAARMAKEAGSSNYQTIHSFARILAEDEDLGASSNMSGSLSKDDAEETPHAKMVIMDEMSMCTLPMFRRVMEMFEGQPESRIVIVGDDAQLPAIGPQFFAQLGACLIPQLPTTRLNVVHRSGKRAELTDFCNHARLGEIHLPEQSEAVQLVPQSSIRNFLDGHMELARDSSVLFLAMKKKDINELNIRLRRIRLGKAEEITPGLCVGDPVITSRNDYASSASGMNHHPERDIDIPNGTQGVIQGFDEDKEEITILMDLPSRDEPIVVKYALGELTSLVEPAYAITVHKAQGNQADRVVFFADAKSGMLNRNMFYTAVTRATEQVIVVGDEEELQEKIRPLARQGFSKFAWRVRSYLERQSLPAKKEENEIVGEGIVL